MGTKHKHYDVIVAWAAGEEIEFKSTECANWQNWMQIHAPSFHRDLEWRIKPKTVKKEGWVNVYGDNAPTFIWPSKASADQVANIPNIRRKACVRIEWEEEE